MQRGHQGHIFCGGSPAPFWARWRKKRLFMLLAAGRRQTSPHCLPDAARQCCNFLPDDSVNSGRRGEGGL